MYQTGFVLFLALSVFVLAGCDSGTESSDKNEPNKEKTSEKNTPSIPDLSTKEQYVAEARKLVDNLIEIVNQVKDTETAAKALEACNKLKPLADELGKAAKKLRDAVGDDATAKSDLVKYMQSNCHSDAELKPLIDKLGESEKKSKYPELLRTVGSLLETSMHNHF